MVDCAPYTVLLSLDLLFLQPDALVHLTSKIFYIFGNFSIGSLPYLRYWDTRQSNPVHTQQLPDRCYALTVRHPLMVVGTADRNLIVFNLQNPQVMFSHNEMSEICSLNDFLVFQQSDASIYQTIFCDSLVVMFQT